MLDSESALNQSQPSIILVAQQRSEPPTDNQKSGDALIIMTALGVFIVFILLLAGLGWCWKIFSNQSVNNGKDDSNQKSSPGNDIEFPTGDTLIDVEFTGESQDNKFLDVKATVYVYIDIKRNIWDWGKSDLDNVKSSLSRGGNVTYEDIANAVRPRAIGEFKRVLKSKNLADIQSEKNIWESLKSDIKKLGLTLTSVQILSIENLSDIQHPIEIELLGSLAARTKDFLRAGVRGVVFVSVKKHLMSHSEINEIVKHRTEHVIRKVVAEKDLASITGSDKTPPELKQDLASITNSKTNLLEKEIKNALEKILPDLQIHEVVITETSGLTLSGDEVYVNDLSTVEYPIDLEFVGSSALRTKDFLRADVRGIVFVTTTHHQMSLNEINGLVKQRAAQVIRQIVYQYKLEEIAEPDRTYFSDLQEIISETIQEFAPKKDKTNRIDDHSLNKQLKNALLEFTAKRDIAYLSNLAGSLQSELQNVLPEFFTIKKVVITEVKGSNFYNIIYPIEIALINESSVRTKDYIRANIRGVAFVSLNSKEEENIQKQERNKITNFISEDGTISKDILTKNVQIRAESVFLETSRKFSFNDINESVSFSINDVPQAVSSSESNPESSESKPDFFKKVQTQLSDKLKEIGLSLKDLAIIEVNESDFHRFGNNNNILDILWSQNRQEEPWNQLKVRNIIDLAEIASRNVINGVELEAAIAILNQEKESAEIKAQIANTIKLGEVENEAFRIEKIAEAEAKRQQISIDDAIAKLIAESSPHLIEILPKLAEVVKALGLQPGVLENTHIYTLPTNHETQDVSELVRFLSAYPMIIRLLEILWNQRQNKS